MASKRDTDIPPERCAICGASDPNAQLRPIAAIQPSLLTHMNLQHALNENGFICSNDLNKLRADYIQRIFEDEVENVTKLEESVMQSLSAHELVTIETLTESNEEISRGERLADGVTRFGGSWGFIISFALILIAWITINSIQAFGVHFDPYPFILLNLVLSCIAAVQAPIIMMSQNRQEAKDRKRAENDYRVNLKAELEIRHLHEKIDHLLIEQWKRLAEIQKVQVDFLESLDSSIRPRQPR